MSNQPSTRNPEEILAQLESLQAENKKLRAELAQSKKRRDGEVEGYNSWENKLPPLGKKGPPINATQVKMKELETENSTLKDTLNQLSGKFDALMKQMAALQQIQPAKEVTQAAPPPAESKKK